MEAADGSGRWRLQCMRITIWPLVDLLRRHVAVWSLFTHRNVLPGLADCFSHFYVSRGIYITADHYTDVSQTVSGGIDRLSFLDDCYPADHSYCIHDNGFDLPPGYRRESVDQRV